MKMFFLWLVNNLLVLTLFFLYLGTEALAQVEPSDDALLEALNSHGVTFIVVAAIAGLFPAIFTAKFAKANFGDMMSSGFIRWTSSFNLWKSEWAFFFKTLFVAWFSYGMIVFFIELIVCVWLGL